MIPEVGEIWLSKLYGLELSIVEIYNRVHGLDDRCNIEAWLMTNSYGDARFWYCSNQSSYMVMDLRRRLS